MKKDDGGPAFPKADTVETKDVYYGDFPTILDGGTGMSLRDYFAAKAMCGTLSAETEDYCILGEGEVSRYRKIAEECYRFADAMIEARKQ